MTKNQMTPESLGIGQLVTEDRGRDAVHFAVIPVVARAEMHPGTPAGVEAGEAFPTHHHRAIGIVDPFLADSVRRGQRFWLFLKPGTITGMRHHWEHPAFPDEPSRVTESPAEVTASREWLEAFAYRIGHDYQTLLDGACGYLANSANGIVGDWHIEGEYDPEFWDHFENVTGRRVRESARGNFFICSC